MLRRSQIFYIQIQGCTPDSMKKSLRTAALGNALSALKERDGERSNQFLAAACRGGHADVAELLLTSGAQVDAHDPDGATPLLAAADSGFSKCVQLLLKHGAHADAKDRVGVTALIAAAYNGHIECVRVLLTHGALVDARSHGGVTPLIAAAEGCNALCTQVLVQAGAQVDAKTSEGKTALIHAVSRNCIEATEALLVGGADVNAIDADGCTALHHGARNDSVECLQILMERDADSTRKCRRGRTPLQEALIGSAAAKLLEERWKQLESEIARRQAELLNLFAQDRTEPSNTRKSVSRQARVKKKGKRKKDLGERVESGRDGEFIKLVSKTEIERGTPAMDMSSSSGSDAEGGASENEREQVMVGLGVGSEEENVCENRSVEPHEKDATSGGKSPCMSPKVEREFSESSGVEGGSPSSSHKFKGDFPAGDDATDKKGEEWVRVDGKGMHNHHQRLSCGLTTKTGSPTKSLAGSKARHSSSKSLKLGESYRMDAMTNNSMQSTTVSKSHNAQRSKQTETMAGGVTKKLAKEDESNDTSSWVQALMRRNDVVVEGNYLKPQLRPGMKAFSEPRSEATWETAEVAPFKEIRRSPKERLSDRVRGIEQVLERERRAAQVEMQKVRELERLVAAGGLGSAVESANSLQVIELREALEVQVTARVQAETAKTQLEVHVREMEVLITSQRLALEEAKAEVADLRLEMRQREEQHKRECDLQHKESVAAAMAAAAASWRAWELQHTRGSLRGAWATGSQESPAHGEFAPLLHRAGLKIHLGIQPPLPFLLQKKHRARGAKQRPEWDSAATAAAVAAATMIGRKNCACLLLGHLRAHSPAILAGGSRHSTIIDPVPKPVKLTASQVHHDMDSTAAASLQVCNWCGQGSHSGEASPPLSPVSNKMETDHSQNPKDDVDLGSNQAGRLASNKSAGKSPGVGITRSASESSLDSMQVVSELQQPQLLSFVPMAGPKIDPVNGWFSLVPSPVED